MPKGIRRQLPATGGRPADPAVPIPLPPRRHAILAETFHSADRSFQILIQTPLYFPL